MTTYPEATLCQPTDDILDTGVVRAELYLAGEVEENVVVLVKFLEAILEPIVIRLKVLHTVKHPSVRPKAKLVHGIFKLYERADVDCARVGDVFVCMVEIDDSDRAIECSEKLVFFIAISRLSASRRAAYNLSEWHSCCRDEEESTKGKGMQAGDGRTQDALVRGPTPKKPDSVKSRAVPTRAVASRAGVSSSLHPLLLLYVLIPKNQQEHDSLRTEKD